jgi:fatty acid-binding protein DegV
MLRRAVHLSSENTALVLDSTADLPDPAARHANWRLVPLYVRFGDETFRDHVDLTPREFYGRLRDAPATPKSSQPTPADFASASSSPGSSRGRRRARGSPRRSTATACA